MHFNRITLLIPLFVLLASAMAFAVHFNQGEHGGAASLSFSHAHAAGDGSDSGGGGGGGGDGGDSGGGGGNGNTHGGDSGGGGGNPKPPTGGCGNGSTCGNNNPPPKPTCTLSANPTSISLGGSSTLSWTTTNATSASIDHGVGAATPVAGGSTSVSPTSDTTYTLTATGAGGTVTCSAPVTIKVAPKPTCTLVANPTSIIAGGSSTLTWTTTNATSASIDHGIGAVTPVAGGTKSVSPGANTTYTLTATGAGGTVTCPATITVSTVVHNAPTCTLVASPTSIVKGNSSTLTWTTTDATSFTIDQNVGSVTPVAGGTKSVSPTADTTYTGTATGPDGTVTCHAAITVTIPQPNEPTCTLSASPTTLNSGDHTTLTWTTTNADTFSIDQGIGAVTPAAGGTVQSKAVNADTTFTGTATAPNGHTVTCTAPVTINHGGGGGGPTCTMTISQSSVAPGGSATLTWGGSDIHNVDIDNGIATATSSPGSTIVSPTSDTTYVGTFHANNGQTLTCQASVTVTTGGGGCAFGCGGGGGNPPVITLTSLPHATTQPLAYLYLSQIPYTGLDLGPIGTVLYWAALIGWSLALAYLVLFAAVPFANRRLQTFGTRVSEALNAHESAAAVERTREPAPVRPIAPVMRAAASSEAPRSYSAYEGFKSFAPNRPLSVDDIVKGLARGSSVPPRAVEPVPMPEPVMTQEAPRRAQRTEPIYENVEPVYDRVEPIEMPPRAQAPRAPMPELVPEVPNFISTLLAGDREGVFSALRAVAMQGGDTEAFLTQVACALDDAYRARLEGAPVHPEIARITQSVATPVLERVVTAFATAVDSSYSIGITGAKLALTRALAVLGA